MLKDVVEDALREREGISSLRRRRRVVGESMSNLRAISGGRNRSVNARLRDLARKVIARGRGKAVVSETLVKLDTVNGWVLSVYLRTGPFFTQPPSSTSPNTPSTVASEKCILLHHAFHGHGCVHVVP